MLPPRVFLKTRRFWTAVAVSVALTMCFESFYTRSFSMPSIDYSWDTPLSYFLGPILGTVCVMVVNSAAPQMERLAVAPIKCCRTELVVCLCVIQWFAMYVFHFVANALILKTPMTSQDLTTLFVSTLAFQALGMFSGVLFSSLKTLILPGVALMTCVGFGFNRDTTPRPFHVLMGHTTPVAVLIVACWVVAVVCLLTVRPSICEK
ncbi:MAG: hypothetical protein SPI12_00330 [Actinomycetaceae bacterium]|nr:hypothetical protein [Actinomycetaceae bacterium]MDY6082300.1 hypothetical protein [Actinomycetaceae bacterium]